MMLFLVLNVAQVLIEIQKKLGSKKTSAYEFICPEITLSLPAAYWSGVTSVRCWGRALCFEGQWKGVKNLEKHVYRIYHSAGSSENGGKKQKYIPFLSVLGRFI